MPIHGPDISLGLRLQGCLLHRCGMALPRGHLRLQVPRVLCQPLNMLIALFKRPLHCRDARLVALRLSAGPAHEVGHFALLSSNLRFEPCNLLTCARRFCLGRSMLLLQLCLKLRRSHCAFLQGMLRLRFGAFELLELLCCRRTLLLKLGLQLLRLHHGLLQTAFELVLVFISLVELVRQDRDGCLPSLLALVGCLAHGVRHGHALSLQLHLQLRSVGRRLHGCCLPLLVHFLLRLQDPRLHVSLATF
mmetsp:Transcript_80555/g.202657  ORF Transcript_80555/g.202657 Transcript_80555/m.202657 type:complete len:248 (-) Transcript_80555:622-1365(-)